MDEFEQQLRRAMAREEPPAWFEAKVMAAVARNQQVKRPWWSLRWATAGTAAALILVCGIAYRQDQMAEQRSGEEAKAKLELALRITSSKLRHIEQRVATIQENN